MSDPQPLHPPQSELSRRISSLLAVAKARALPDPAHDFLHVQRVLASAQHIATQERANVFVCSAAAALHELFNYPKGHPESKRSGEICAEHARLVLQEHGASTDEVEAVCYAIASHPFSLGITPTTLEAKVMQDADRLDAIGAIGIARCFASCAEMQRPFYSELDPMCETRAPNDKEFGLDHFFTKLLRIDQRLNTDTARGLAQERMRTMRAYLDSLRAELRVG